MEFVKSLRPEHWQSFWYFASEFNFGLIGVLSFPLAQEMTPVRAVLGWTSIAGASKRQVRMQYL